MNCAKIHRHAWLGVFLLLFRNSCGAVTRLTHDNYEQVTVGKSVFVKFYAPWCGHCRAMAADWERLADEWEGHPVGLIGEVDCTSDEGKVLCEDFEVTSFPTLLFGDPMSPETYDGERDYDAMAAFAQEKIARRICSFFVLDNCDSEERKVLEELAQLSDKDLEAISVGVEKDVKDAEKAFDVKVDALQKEYDKMVTEFNQELEKIKRERHYKYVEQILSTRIHGPGDEL